MSITIGFEAGTDGSPDRLALWGAEVEDLEYNPNVEQVERDGCDERVFVLDVEPSEDRDLYIAALRRIGVTVTGEDRSTGDWLGEQSRPLTSSPVAVVRAPRETPRPVHVTLELDGRGEHHHVTLGWIPIDVSHMTTDGHQLLLCATPDDPPLTLSWSDKDPSEVLLGIRIFQTVNEWREVNTFVQVDGPDDAIEGTFWIEDMCCGGTHAITTAGIREGY